MIALAIAGVLVAAAVAVIASQLASRQIGLASEPVSAGDELAPALARPEREQGNNGEGGRPIEGGEKTTAPSTGTPTDEAPASTTEPGAVEPPATIEPPAEIPEPAIPRDDSIESRGGEGGEGGGHGDD